MTEGLDAINLIRHNTDIKPLTKAAVHMLLVEGQPDHPNGCAEELMDEVVWGTEGGMRREVLEAVTTADGVEQYGWTDETGEYRSAVARVACVKGCQGVIILDNGAKGSLCILKASVAQPST